MDMTDQTLEERTDFTANVGKISIGKFGFNICDTTTRKIHDHMCKLMGMRIKDSVDQSDPSWVPPPFMDFNKIKDPALRKEWQDTVDAENQGLIDRGCVEERKLKDVPADKRKSIIGTMTTNTVKRNKKKKARTVALGNQQKAGIHFDRSHSPTIMHASMRVLFAIAAALKMKIKGGDFSQAFANAALPPEDQYWVWPPKTARQYDDDGDRIVWLVKNALYGSKDASRRWYYLLKTFLTTGDKLGFTQSSADPCVFFKNTAKGRIIIGLPLTLTKRGTG